MQIRPPARAGSMLTTLPALATVAVLTAACGAAGTSQPPTATDENEARASVGAGDDEPAGATAACELLTPSDIEPIVGNAVEEGTSTTNLDCTWGSGPDDTSVSLGVLLATADQCQAALSADTTQRSVDGHGAPAFWSWVGAQGGAGTLSLCAPQEMISVTVSFGLDAVPDEEAALEQAGARAAIALLRR